MPNPDGSPTAEELAQLQAAEYGIPPANVVNAPVTEITSDAAPSRSLEDKVEQGIRYLKKLGTPFGMVPDSVGKPTPVGPKGQNATATSIPGDESAPNDDFNAENAGRTIDNYFATGSSNRGAPAPNYDPGGKNWDLLGGKENVDNYTKVAPNAQMAAVAAAADVDKEEGDQVADHWKRAQDSANQQLGAIQSHRQQFLEQQELRQRELEDRTAKYTANLSDGKAFWKSPANVFGALVTSLMPLGTMSVETSQKIINNAIQQDFKNRQEVADGHLGALRSNLNGYRQLAGDKVAGDYLALGESYKVAAMELERISASFKGEHAQKQAQLIIGKLMEESARNTMAAHQAANLNPSVMTTGMQKAWQQRPEFEHYGPGKAPPGQPVGGAPGGAPMPTQVRPQGQPEGQAGSPAGASVSGPVVSPNGLMARAQDKAVRTLQGQPEEDNVKLRAGDNIKDRAMAAKRSMVNKVAGQLPPAQRGGHWEGDKFVWDYDSSRMAYEKALAEKGGEAIKEITKQPQWHESEAQLKQSQGVIASMARFEHLMGGKEKAAEAYDSILGGNKAIDVSAQWARLFGRPSSPQEAAKLDALRKLQGDFAYLQSQENKILYGANKGLVGTDNDEELAKRWADTSNWRGLSNAAYRVNTNHRNRMEGLINASGASGDPFHDYAKMMLLSNMGRNNVSSGFRPQGRPGK